jgi:peptidoglycan/LPS O-acetylase OafA/YrhL
LRYRPDIDGLRAVAVLPVVAFHVGISAFPGGFVGVDVFFVISGYLISWIILSEFEQGHFSILSFYERRIRRIFPALVVMLLATAVVAFIYLLPVELEQFASSLLAAILSVSNFYFWFHSGYFDVAADQQPLLHTWSLAVEEQFYILFPLFLLLIRRFFPVNLRTGIIGLALLSLSISAVGAFRDPTTTFYLPHTRAWELLLGTILAMEVLPPIRNALVNNLASAVGLGMIIYAIFAFSAATPFPGLAALVPCVGTGLVIHAGRDGRTLTNRVLSLSPLVFVGLISYSLYLWHWPLIFFQRNDSILFAGFSSSTGKVLLFAASMILATVSWWFVERPFRRGPLRMPARPLFLSAAVATVTICSISIVTLLLDGVPSRFSPAEIQAASYLNYDPGSDYREGTCFINDGRGQADLKGDICLKQVRGRKNVLLFGDSYAADLWYGLTRSFGEVNFLQATGAGCKPTLAQARTTDVTLRRCAKLMDSVFFDYLAKNKVDALLIAESWRKDDLPALASTLDWANARGIKVILFGPKVQYDAPLPRILVATIRYSDPGLPDRHRPSSYETLDEEMSQLARSKGVTYISFFQLLCKQEACLHSDQAGHPLSFDIGHFTRWGSLVVAQKLRGFQWP